MVGIHIGVNLKYESCHLLLRRLDVASLCRRRTWRGCNTDKALQQLSYTKVVDRRTEEYGSKRTLKVGLAVEVVVNTLYQLQILTQLRSKLRSYIVVQFGRGDIAEIHSLGVSRLTLIGCKEREILLVDVVHALERIAARDGECQRTYTNLQLALNLIQQIERVLARAVQLIDKYHYGGIAHTAYVHQLTSLRLDTLRSVNNDDNRIYGRQRTIGILGKILVTRGIEDVDFHILIVESHNRCSNRDTALALDFHKVGCGTLLNLIALYSTRNVDGTSKEEQLLGKSGLTGIGVCNNGKCSSFGYLVN